MFGLDGTHRQLCGSVSQGMMHEAAAMPTFNAAAARPMISLHHRGQMPSQYASSSSVSMPAHQAPVNHHQAPVNHSRVVVDNIYSNVPGIFAVFLSFVS